MHSRDATARLQLHLGQLRAGDNPDLITDRGRVPDGSIELAITTEADAIRPL
jgi:hypothetical protein